MTVVSKRIKNDLDNEIGVRMDGVDISKPINETTFTDIHRHYLDWGVMLLRGQQQATAQHFTEFCGRLENSSRAIYPR